MIIKQIPIYLKKLYWNCRGFGNLKCADKLASF